MITHVDAGWWEVTPVRPVTRPHQEKIFDCAGKIFILLCRRRMMAEAAMACIMAMIPMLCSDHRPSQCGRVVKAPGDARRHQVSVHQC